MKKLMIAALAVASCTAFAEGEKLADNAVYNLSFTTKYLDYNSKAYKADGNNPEKYPELKCVEQTRDSQGKIKKTGDYELQKAVGGVLNGKVTNVVVYTSCELKYDIAVRSLSEDFAKKGVELSVTDYKPTTKKIAIYVEGVNKQGNTVAVKDHDEVVTTAITFKYQDLSKSKVVTKNLSGVVIVDNNEMKSFIWDPQEKGEYVNEFAGSTFNKQKSEWKAVKIANASKAEGAKFEFKRGVFSADNNAEGGFGWDIGGKNPACGWGTGKVALDGIAKNKADQKPVYSSLQGGYAGSVEMDHMLSIGEFGTWKLSYDKASTQILRIKTKEDALNSNVARRYAGEDYNKAGIPESYEEILGKKKVEIVD